MPISQFEIRNSKFTLMSRKRIVINLDAPPDGAATAPGRPLPRTGKKRRWPRVLGMLVTLLLVLVVGLAVGAHLMHMPPRWIGVGVIVMVGLGILTGVTITRGRDPSS